MSYCKKRDDKKKTQAGDGTYQGHEHDKGKERYKHDNTKNDCDRHEDGARGQ